MAATHTLPLASPGMARICLYGDLQRFGRRIDLRVKTGAEAIRALATQLPAFRQKLSDGWYQVRIAGRDTGETELSARLNEPLANGAVIHIVPRLAGAKSGGVFQVVLGAAFGWSIPMAFSAVSESLPLSCWLMFLANILWAVAYDTQYAMVDRDDDVKIGIKSTAILFGENDRLIIGILQVAVLALMGAVGWLNGLGWEYYWSLFVAAGLFGWQQKLIFNRDRDNCFKAFMNNNYVGLVLFLGLAMSYL